MQQASFTRRINASPDRVWPLVSDVRAIAHWHFNVATVDLLTRDATGLGAARRCNFHDGSSVREEVVGLQEGRLVRLQLSEFSLPMKHIELRFDLVPAGAGATDVTVTLGYVVKFGILGRLLGATAVRRQMRGVLTRLLAGLEHHLATGEDIGKDFVARAA
jgi:uncharacterized protein YndB with AHSA1/START domain